MPRRGSFQSISCIGCPPACYLPFQMVGGVSNPWVSAVASHLAGAPNEIVNQCALIAIAVDEETLRVTQIVMGAVPQENVGYQLIQFVERVGHCLCVTSGECGSVEVQKHATENGMPPFGDRGLGLRSRKIDFRHQREVVQRWITPTTSRNVLTACSGDLPLSASHNPLAAWLARSTDRRSRRRPMRSASSMNMSASSNCPL